MFCRVATHIVGAFVLAAVVSGPAPAAHAATIFSDNFNEDSTGAKTSTTNFTVTNLNGSIDVIANGDFSLPCVDGNCIDFDGATNVAAVFASKSITLSPAPIH